MLCAEDRIDTGFFSYEPGSPDALIHNDHLATPQKMTDSSGQVVWSADYKPFGEATVTVSTITNNLRFPGQYYDTETGLNYNYFRDYNPVIGRYIESDPIGLRGGINLNVYVRNRPINRIDSAGLMDIDPTGFYDSTPVGMSTLGGYGQGGIQGAIHIGPVGFSASGGLVGSGGAGGAAACAYVTVCVRLGPGIYVGGGLYSGSIQSLGGLSVGGGGDIGMVTTVGGQAGVSLNGAGSITAGGFAKGKGGGGGGFSAGIDICWTELRCKQCKN